MASWSDTNSTSWGAWATLGSFPAMLLMVFYSIPIDVMLQINSLGVGIVIFGALLFFCFLWIKGILIAKRTLYKVSVISDGKIILSLHFNKRVIISKENVAYVTPYTPLTIDEVMVETANSRNKEYALKLTNGFQVRIPYTMYELEELLNFLANNVEIDEKEFSIREKEQIESKKNGLIYGICTIAGLVIVGFIIALLFPYIDSRFGEESAGAFWFVWMALTLVFGQLIGLLIGYYVVRKRSGKVKAFKGLVGE